MGTVLSFSPKPRKPLYEDINLNNFNYEILNNAKNQQQQQVQLSQTKEKNLKKHSIFISTLSWKRFSVGSSKKKENKNQHMKFSSRLPCRVDSSLSDVENNNNNSKQSFTKSISCYSLKTTSLPRSNTNNNLPVSTSSTNTTSEQTGRLLKPVGSTREEIRPKAHSVSTLVSHRSA